MTYVDVYAVQDAYTDVWMVLDAFDRRLRDYNPDQPRVPAGSEGGGQWTSGGQAGGSEPPRSRYRDKVAEEWMGRGVEPKDQDALQKLNSLNVDPEDFHRKMMGGHDGDLKAEVSRYDGALMLTGVRHNALSAANPGRRPPDFMFARILRGDGTAEHTYFQVHEDLQGTSLAKDILSGQVDMYQELGMDRVTLEANLDVGGYAWAKYGFEPETNMSWRRAAEHVENLVFDLHFDQGRIDLATHDAVLKLTESPQKRSLWAIADIRTPVRAEDYETGEVVTRPLGKHLLMGSSWGGVLDLKDEASMQRFRSYVGGRRRIRDYSPDQPRVPAGQEGGGQWASTGSSVSSVSSDLQELRRLANERRRSAKEYENSDPGLASKYEDMAEKYDDEADRIQQERHDRAFEEKGKHDPEESDGPDAYVQNQGAVRHFEDVAEGARTRAAKLTERIDRISDDPLNSRRVDDLEKELDQLVERADRYDQMAQRVMDNPLLPEDWGRAGVRFSDDRALGYLNSLGASPSDFHEMVTGGHGGRLQVSSDPYGKMRVFSDNPDLPFKFARVLDFDDGFVSNDYFKVNSGQQGASIGKDVLLGQAALYEQSGLFNGMKTRANLDVGGYAWAKYGYVPSQSSWDNIRQYARYMQVSDPTERQAVRRILSSDDPKAMWALADSKHGKDLLLGSSWDGMLHFRDPEAMRRFRTYLGGNR